MKTETIVLIVIGGAAIAAGAVYYAKQKQTANTPVNPLAAPTNGNTANRSAPADSTSSDVANYTKAAGDALSQVETFFGW
jgi:hypothetical protein